MLPGRQAQSLAANKRGQAFKIHIRADFFFFYTKILVCLQSFPVKNIVEERLNTALDFVKETPHFPPWMLIYNLSKLLSKGDKGNQEISSPICAAPPSGPVPCAELVHEAHVSQ